MKWQQFVMDEFLRIEDELQEVVEAGLISPETAKALYAKG